MPLIKAGRAIADSFIHVADDEPLPTDGAIIIGLARWQEERGLSSRAATRSACAKATPIRSSRSRAISRGSA